MQIALGQNTQVLSGMHVHKGANVGVFGNLENSNDSLLNQGHISMMGDSLTNKQPLSGNGTLVMMGANEQHISHAGDIRVDSLVLDNVYNISFDNNIFIAKHGAFVNGILYDIYNESVLPDDLPYVVFGKNANVDSMQVRDDSHVDGLVKKIGNTDFTFPIGHSNYYRPAVASNLKADTTIAAKYYYMDIEFPGSSLASWVHLFPEEYWYIFGNEGGYNLGLSFDERTSAFDPKEDSLKIIAFNAVRNESYRLIDITNAVSTRAPKFIANAVQTDPEFFWYGFAKVNRLEKTIDDIQQILTPNGDGDNDLFIIPQIEKYTNNKIVIFNRHGNVVYTKEQYDNSWNGTANQPVVGSTPGNLLPTGTYFVFFYVDDKLVYKDFVQVVYGY